MAELLVELFSEEIPARMQVAAAKQLEESVTKKLSEHGLAATSAAHYSTPRRLTLVLDGLPLEQPDVFDERKGPRVGAPEKAVEGFLRGAGVASLDDCEIRSDKKGEFYVAVIEKKGGATSDVIAKLVPEVVREFHWPKSMKWGSGSLRWVRPLHSILCVFDGGVVPFEVDHISSGNTTYGHRFHAPEAIEVKDFVAYETALAGAKVVLTREARKETIWTDAQKLATAEGFEVAEDQGLLEEVTGLIELPVVLMGTFDEAFLDVPPEVLISAMRSHQKYFAVNDPKTGKLANKFVFVANLKAEDGGTAIVAGNERVLNARLSDAKFFWDQDRKVTLESRVEKLKDIVFYDKLGTVFDKVQRVRVLAREIAPLVGADSEKADRAALLAKADLVSGMVAEFPDLQGYMGRYYALEEGIESEIADAIRDHYSPQGADGLCPVASLSVAVALADRIDTLVGFWEIGELPTGSKDPFALRRAALGILRLLDKNKTRTDLLQQFDRTHEANTAFQARQNRLIKIPGRETNPKELVTEITFKSDVEEEASVPISTGREFASSLFLVQPNSDDDIDWNLGEAIVSAQPILENTDDGEAIIAYVTNVGWHERESKKQTREKLQKFFDERLSFHFRSEGKRYDLVKSVLSNSDGLDPVLVDSRLSALGEFLDTEDGQNLLAGYKRAANILRIEEKKDKTSYSGTADEKLLEEKAEKKLFAAIQDADPKIAAALAKEDFKSAMAAVAQLRGPVDAFFDDVTVNADDLNLRANRLKLLSQIRTSLEGVADFSKIEG